MAKKVFVSGCFDMLHSGHVAFLSEAATYGDVYVCIGSDDNVRNLKGRYPICTQSERKYMLEALSSVKECLINSSMGIIDFLIELDNIRPDIFIVNEDGHTPEKSKLCAEKGIEYKILKRLPHGKLPRRSTTDLKVTCTIPFRIDLAGGWLDQPFVSKYYPGPVLTISIEPDIEFNNRSGMASSTRNKAKELWHSALPDGDRELLAKILFAYENPPGTKEVAGSQDTLGIILPGLNKLNYKSDYWPYEINSIHDDDILKWLEDHIRLVNLGPRVQTYSVINNTNITEAGARDLANAAENCWKAILNKDLPEFGKAFRESFMAQLAMFPNMAGDEIFSIIDQYKDKAYGWKLSGAGGGGYMILITDKSIENSIRIRIRRKDNF